MYLISRRFPRQTFKIFTITQNFKTLEFSKPCKSIGQGGASGMDFIEYGYRASTFLHGNTWVSARIGYFFVLALHRFFLAFYTNLPSPTYVFVSSMIPL